MLLNRSSKPASVLVLAVGPTEITLHVEHRPWNFHKYYVHEPGAHPSLGISDRTLKEAVGGWILANFTTQEDFIQKDRIQWPPNS